MLDLLDDWLRTIDTLDQQAETYNRYTQRPGGSSWEGMTAEATQTRAGQDYRAVASLRACVERATTQIRNTVTSTLMPPLSNAQQIIANAEASPGVTVNEDLSITYTPPAGTSQETADANNKVVAAAAAELKESAQEWWSAENQVAQQIRDAQSAISNAANFGPTAPHFSRRARIQTVDRHWKQDPAQPTPNPAADLGLPDYQPGSLSNDEARAVYTQGELNMRQLNERLTQLGLNPEQRAKIMFDQRNSLRTWVRDLMSNRTRAAELAASEPNMTYEQIIAKNQAKGLVGNNLYNAIIDSSTRSRASVNDSMGIDPQRPPPLPPVRPSAPIEGAPAAEPRLEPPAAGRGGPTGPEGGTGSPRAGGVGPNAGAGGTLGGGGGAGGARGGGGGGIMRPFPEPGMPQW
ncbi:MULTISPECIES: hypothetical protein [Mycobacterium]|uniref:hypothetical protein n=1 Tax=Mycobacterium TaxID=1763 RepID=UPI0013C41A0F|nr:MULTISPECIES: hypothetical protein [Mycobacterium]MDP7707584.1 hypothetical protein [Mycobacterium sp. TY815]